jgi:sialidase-1
VVETALGSLLVTNFTSLAYEPILRRVEAARAAGQTSAEPPLIEEWQAVHGRLDGQQRQAELGSYMLRSTDGGVTWSARYRVPVNSPHGPLVLRDGRLLYPGKALYAGGTVGVWESTDDGQSWELLADIPARDGDTTAEYHELHAVEAADGRLICHIRNHNPAQAGETLQSESHDGGRTWTPPRSIGVWGLPSHLLRLRDGRLLMTYGHRRQPLGNQARISEDHGRSWSEPLLLSQDGTSGDLGYPSTVECDEGLLVTVWYEVLTGSPLAQLRQTRWRLQ